MSVWDIHCLPFKWAISGWLRNHKKNTWIPWPCFPAFRWIWQPFSSFLRGMKRSTPKKWNVGIGRISGVITLPSWTMQHERSINQIYQTCALFDLPKYGQIKSPLSTEQEHMFSNLFRTHVVITAYQYHTCSIVLITSHSHAINTIK